MEKLSNRHDDFSSFKDHNSGFDGPISLVIERVSDSMITSKFIMCFLKLKRERYNVTYIITKFGKECINFTRADIPILRILHIQGV